MYIVKDVYKTGSLKVGAVDRSELPNCEQNNENHLCYGRNNRGDFRLL